MKAVLDEHDKSYLQTSLDLSDEQMAKCLKYLGEIDMSVECSVLGEAEDWVENVMEDDEEDDDDPD